LLAGFGVAQEKANIKNEQRFQQGMDIFDQIIQRYESGGTFEKATEAGIARGETKAVAQGTQSLVSSGLSGTTQAAGLSKKFQEEVGEPARLQASDIAAQRLSEAQMGKIGFIERREDTGPDFSTIAQLAQSIGQGQEASYRPQQQRGGGGTPSGSYSSQESIARRAYEQATQRSRTQASAQRTQAKSASLAASYEANRARPSSQPKEQLKITYGTPTYGANFTGAPQGGDASRRKQAYQPFNWDNVPGH
jgi:hypothetical protein